MKVVVLGYGSIGSRHARILKNNLKIKDIFIFSKQKIKKYKSFNSLAEIKKINPNYVIIANNTRSHFFYLKYLENNFKNIVILVEKPLFHRRLPLRIKTNPFSFFSIVFKQFFSFQSFNTINLFKGG